MYIQQEIAERIKKQAKLHNVVLKDMLKNIGTGVNLISHLSKGQEISYLTLAKIADYLDCSVDYLLGRTNEPQIRKIADTHDNSIQDPQTNVLLDIFDELDQINRSKLLVYADELKKQQSKKE